MSEFDYSMTAECNYDMSHREVVEVLQSQRDLLRDELKRRDKVIAGLIEVSEKAAQLCSGFHEWQDKVVLLKHIQSTNMAIHEGIRPHKVEEEK